MSYFKFLAEKPQSQAFAMLGTQRTCPSGKEDIRKHCKLECGP